MKQKVMHSNARSRGSSPSGSGEAGTIRQITLRGIDPGVAQEIQRIARAENLSLNQAALRLLKKGAGLAEEKSPPQVIGNSLDRWIGNWSEEEAREFLDSIQSCEQIDPEMWR
jgi:hypothetical protein